ncbi:MAG: zinc-binding dehydrogenase [Vulcanisaeta sp. MG_3]|jgi:Threonine dehydrogenase and related Zn-dependent dehydrogenases|nr:MAG: zinc-binding dehydrogenase [Vulcanisaeta sp. MG_3]
MTHGTQRALVLHGPMDARIEEVDIPKPPEGWVLVKTLAVGICGTDKAFYRGTYPLFKRPLIPGHEVSGVVIGGDLDGRFVVSEINFPCGKCHFCRQGLYTHCPYRKTLGIDFDGGFAEYFIAPITALHTIDGIDPVVATQVEPLAAVLNDLEQYPITPSMNVAIIGTGNLAYLTAQVLRAMGVNYVVIARRGSAKARYFRAIGAEILFEDEVNDYIARNTPEGQGFDATFEVSGNAEAINTAINITRPRGFIHLKSTPGSQFKADLTKAVVKELRMVGSRCGTFREFKRAIELIRNGTVKPLITSVVNGIDNGLQSLERSLKGDEMKVVVRI